MDLARLTGGTNSESSINYKIYAWVLWTGRKVTSVHYTAYIRNGEQTVLEIDDERIKEKGLLSMINDKRIQSGVKMAIYVREQCTLEDKLDRSKLNLTLESLYDMENILKGNYCGPTGLVDRQDLLRATLGENLNGQIIDAFFS